MLLVQEVVLLSQESVERGEMVWGMFHRCSLLTTCSRKYQGFYFQGCLSGILHEF